MPQVDHEVLAFQEQKNQQGPGCLGLPEVLLPLRVLQVLDILFLQAFHCHLVFLVHLGFQASQVQNMLLVQEVQGTPLVLADPSYSFLGNQGDQVDLEGQVPQGYLEHLKALE